MLAGGKNNSFLSTSEDTEIFPKETQQQKTYLSLLLRHDKVRPVRQLWLKTTSSPFCCRCCYANFEMTPPPPTKKKKENQSRWNFSNPRPELVPCHSVAMLRLAWFPRWKLLLLRFSYNSVTANRSYRHLPMKTEQFDFTYLMKM